MLHRLVDCRFTLDGRVDAYEIMASPDWSGPDAQCLRFVDVDQLVEDMEFTPEADDFFMSEGG